MKIPFSTKELDDFLNACIDFTVHHEPYFYTGNISGREGVTTDTDVLKRMMLWVAETDKGLCEDCGFGKDNIHYFRLGHHAIEVMKNGGFKAYLKQKSRTDNLKKIQLWAPIGVSMVAVIVSIFALQKPTSTSFKADVPSLRLVELQNQYEQLKTTVVRLSNTLDALPKNTPPSEPTSP